MTIVYVTADPGTGVISNISDVPSDLAIQYIGDIPKDIQTTFTSLGTYLFLNGEFVLIQ